MHSLGKSYTGGPKLWILVMFFVHNPVEEELKKK